MSKRKSVIAEEADEEEADVQTDEGDIPYRRKQECSKNNEKLEEDKRYIIIFFLDFF